MPLLRAMTVWSLIDGGAAAVMTLGDNAIAARLEAQKATDERCKVVPERAPKARKNKGARDSTYPCAEPNRVDKIQWDRKNCGATNMGILLMSPTEQPIMAGGTTRSDIVGSRAPWQAPQVVKMAAADADVGTRPATTDGAFSTS
ncbi:MAG: hypothetical protein K2Y20_12680 [Sphingomonas sp.]|nr:hypothetical protein [Sphingomonas sp.]